MVKRKQVTAEELLAGLEKDEKYQERRRKQEEAIRADEERLATAQRPLLLDLRAAPGGSELTSVWDLVNTRRKYPELVPVLLAHLDRDYPSRILEGIARALAVKEARVGWEKLVRLFREVPMAPDEPLGVNEFKFALHLAIAAAADLSVLDELVQLAIDRRHGRHRALFVDVLARLNDPRARAALKELRADPDLAWEFKQLDERSRRHKKR